MKSEGEELRGRTENEERKKYIAKLVPQKKPFDPVSQLTLYYLCNYRIIIR